MACPNFTGGDKKADIVANPGCFPTSAILPLAPLLREAVISSENLVIDSKSGVSGAGKGLKATSMFCEVNEGIKAYGVGTHRHGPEIAQELSLAAGNQVSMVFTPHLVREPGYSYYCLCPFKTGKTARGSSSGAGRLLWTGTIYPRIAGRGNAPYQMGLRQQPCGYWYLC